MQMRATEMQLATPWTDALPHRRQGRQEPVQQLLQGPSTLLRTKTRRVGLLPILSNSSPVAVQMMFEVGHPLGFLVVVMGETPFLDRQQMQQADCSQGP